MTKSGTADPPSERNSARPIGQSERRPKGVRNFRTELLEELAEPITIKDGECDVTVSKQRA